MTHTPPRSRRLFPLALSILFAILAAAGPALGQGETYRVLEIDEEGLVTTRAAEVQKPVDGVDPVTYHELYLATTEETKTQLLWLASSETIVLQRRAEGASDYYPMVVSANLQPGKEVLYQAYSLDEEKLIDEFTHLASGPEWGVNEDLLGSLPPGSYTLQATVRSGGRPQTRAAQNVEIRGAGKKESRFVGRPTRPGGERPGEVKPPAGGGGATPVEPVEITPLTEWELPADGRIIYVSSSTGDDRNNGQSPQNAVRTLDRGYDLIRDGRPDWLLLKRGDVFELPDDENGDFRQWDKSGRSPLEPMLIGAYGDEEDARPRLDSNGRGVMKYMIIKNLVLRDLHFYANRRDPNSPEFDGGDGDREYGLHMIQADAFVMQGCLVEYFTINVMLRDDHDPSDPYLTNLRFHRSTFRNAYALDGNDSHGMYFKHVAGVVLTECVLDHNGWNEEIADSYRTGRSHNAYFSDCTQISIEGCTFARESYLSLKIRCELPGWCHDVDVRDNLFLACAFPIDFGANGDDETINFINVTVQGNVFVRTTGWPVDAPRNIHVKATQIRNGLFDSNLFVDNGPDGPDKNEAIRCAVESALENVVVSNNDALLPTPDGADMFSTHYRDRRPTDEVTFINNRENIDPSRYVDASVTIEGYMGTLDGRVRSIDALLDLMADQDSEIDAHLSARGIVAYYRYGFALKP